MVAVTTETLLGVAMPWIAGGGTSGGGLLPPGGLPEVAGVDPPELPHADSNVTKVTATSALLIFEASLVIYELPGKACVQVPGRSGQGREIFSPWNYDFCIKILEVATCAQFEAGYWENPAAAG